MLNNELFNIVVPALILVILALVTGVILIANKSIKTSGEQYPAAAQDKLITVLQILYTGAQITKSPVDNDGLKTWAKAFGLTYDELPNGDVVFKRPAQAPTVTPTASG